MEELMFLSTCNRVEFYFCSKHELDHQLIREILHFLYPQFDQPTLDRYLQDVQFAAQLTAVEHLFEVATSIDSMVVGEREIITQIRKAYTYCKELNLSGDFLRILTKNTIATAKKVYTQTNISSRPVSVVSLAHRSLMTLYIPRDARIIVIGSGVTNTTLCRFLKKQNYSKFAVFNRSLSNGQVLAEELGGTAYPLDSLQSYTEGFDILLSCTGSEEYIVDPSLYSHLLAGDTDKKYLVDLANPCDIDPAVLEQFPNEIISVQSLQAISQENLAIRQKEITQVREIIVQSMQEFMAMHKERTVELAMSNVPTSIKAIKTEAINEIFAKDIDSLDAQSREVLDKVLSYMEKKYISIPMKMAKEIILQKTITK